MFGNELEYYSVEHDGETYRFECEEDIPEWVDEMKIDSIDDVEPVYVFRHRIYYRLACLGDLLEGEYDNYKEAKEAQEKTAKEIEQASPVVCDVHIVCLEHKEFLWKC